jgi:hypothetical protein
VLAPLGDSPRIICVLLFFLSFLSFLCNVDSLAFAGAPAWACAQMMNMQIVGGDVALNLASSKAVELKSTLLRQEDSSQHLENSKCAGTCVLNPSCLTH